MPCSTVDRITPAYAGKTLRISKHRFRSADHPRVCGENNFESSKLGHVNGSPPRMRGKPLKYLMIFKREGITPAYAGKTNSGAGQSLAGEDHPRVCGENRSALSGHWHGGGSPPRMRGKH